MTPAEVEGLERVEEHELARVAAQRRFEVAMSRRRRWDLDGYLCWASAILWIVILVLPGPSRMADVGYAGAAVCFIVGLFCTRQANRAEQDAFVALYRVGKQMGAQASICEALVREHPGRLDVGTRALQCAIDDREIGEALRGERS